jgi:hypothetical protein
MNEEEICNYPKNLNYRDFIAKYLEIRLKTISDVKVAMELVCEDWKRYRDFHGY